MAVAREQNAKHVLKVCSRGYIMEGGDIALADTLSAFIAGPRVSAAYLGERQLGLARNIWQTRPEFRPNQGGKNAIPRQARRCGRFAA